MLFFWSAKKYKLLDLWKNRRGEKKKNGSECFLRQKLGNLIVSLKKKKLENKIKREEAKSAKEARKQEIIKQCC